MTNTTPQVVIACAWYNRSEYIRDTVDSLLSQDFDSFEVVIVNDGSTDPKVKEILDSYSDERLHVIHQENSGFTKSIRRAIFYSKAPYIAVQGAGDISYTNRISTQYRFMVDNASVAILGCGCLTKAPRASDRYSRKRIPEKVIDRKLLQHKVPFTHGTLMLKRSVYEKLKGHDARFKMCSDWDLYVRAISEYKIRGLQEILYEQYTFPDGFTFSPQRKMHQKFFKKAAVEPDFSTKEMMLESYNEHDPLLDINNSKNLKVSLRFMMGAFKRRDFKNLSQWSMVFFRQIVGVFKD